VLIGGTFCLGARFLLLTLKIAYVQLSSYRFALLLGCNTSFIEQFLCLCAVISLLKLLIAYVHF